MSVDLFYEPAGLDGRRGDDSAGSLARFAAEGALAVEMEAAALFALGAGANVAVACMLAVSDTFDAHGTRTRIDDDSLLAAAERMGARRPRARRLSAQPFFALGALRGAGLDWRAAGLSTGSEAARAVAREAGCGALLGAELADVPGAGGGVAGGGASLSNSATSRSSIADRRASTPPSVSALSMRNSASSTPSIR